MKKWFVVLGSVVSALLLATLVTSTVFAQGPVTDGDGVRDLTGDGYGQGRGFGYGFVDEDGDGVNDRYGTNPAFVDEDGDGVCDVCGGLPGEGYNQEAGLTRGNGYGFVDEDNDGINDRYGTNPEFVDEDGDGLCDIHGVAPGEGTAQGYGRGFRTENGTEWTPMARRGGYNRRAAAQ
jgi:hypothetical protein